MKTTLDLTPQIIRRSEAMRRLGRGVFQDAVLAGWLKPCAVKPGTKRPKASIFYNVKDILAVEKRVLGGEYPPRKLILPLFTKGKTKK